MPLRKNNTMFRAIGFVIVLYALSQFFAATFEQVESTSVAVLETVEVAANLSTTQLHRASERIER